MRAGAQRAACGPQYGIARHPKMCPSCRSRSAGHTTCCLYTEGSCAASIENPHEPPCRLNFERRTSGPCPEN